MCYVHNQLYDISCATLYIYTSICVCVYVHSCIYIAVSLIHIYRTDYSAYLQLLTK